MRVRIQTADERIFTVRLDYQDKVEWLKAMIREQKGFPVHSQKLLYHGATLDSRRKLSTYSIRDNSLIKLIINKTPVSRSVKISSEHYKRPNRAISPSSKQKRH